MKKRRTKAGEELHTESGETDLYLLVKRQQRGEKNPVLEEKKKTKKQKKEKIEAFNLHSLTFKSLNSFKHYRSQNTKYPFVNSRHYMN